MGCDVRCCTDNPDTLEYKWDVMYIVVWTTTTPPPCVDGYHVLVYAVLEPSTTIAVVKGEEMATPFVERASRERFSENKIKM
jgi:hypothetical protein